MPVIEQPRGLLSGLLGRKSGAGGAVLGEGIGALPESLIGAVEERAMWAKFGL